MIKTLKGLMLTGVCAFTACGGDGNTDNEAPVDYNRLQAARLDATPLRPTGGETLAAQLRNGLRLQLTGTGWRDAGGPTSPPLPQPAPASPGDAAGGGGSYSGTNVHVQGVDEADVVKYDGRYWYIATSPTQTDPYTLDDVHGIRVAELDAQTPSATIVADFPLSREFHTAALYLSGSASERLTVLRTRWGSLPPRMPGGGAWLTDAVDLMPLPYPDSGAVEIALLDVANAGAPSLTERIEIQGSLLDSRRLGDTLYLVTRFDPWLADLTFEGGNPTLRERNEALLTTARTRDLMPFVRDSEGERALTDSCLTQSDADHLGFASMVFISAIDLSAGEVRGSVCVSGNYGALAMFPEALYLSGDLPEGDTVLHKFDVTPSGVTYAATGTVRGSLSGRADPAFRIDHRDGMTRVVTSSRAWFGGGPGIPTPAPLPTDPAPQPAPPPESGQAAPPPPPQDGLDHYLSVLEQQGQQLVVVGALPNDQRPDAIGKPNEDLYAVRFEDERAYLVTFRRTDPLYALDLSDPRDPFIAGELEVPGFASYLHPLEGDYLFTLGMDADAEGRVRGMKMELVSTAGVTPVIVDSVLLPETHHSEALDNLHALSVLALDDGRYRFALPTTRGVSQADNTYTTVTGLQLLEADLETGTLMDMGVVTAPGHGGYGPQRGLLQDDAVFYASNNQVLSAPFADPAAAQPATLATEPVACPPVVSPSFVLHVGFADNAVSECAAAMLTHSRNAENPAPLAVASLPGFLESDGSCQYRGPEGEYGDFHLSLRQPGYSPAEVGLRVYRDACGPITQQLRTTLYRDDSFPCTADVRPSIALELSLSDGGDGACNAAVVATGGADGERHLLQAFIPPSLPGEPQSYCYFEGPGEVAGPFELEVSLPGYQTERRALEVRADDCHVETQKLGLELRPES